jgi:hypothetical protein
MTDNQMHDPLRVHLRALARLQHIHEEISSGRCPSVWEGLIDWYCPSSS